MDLLDSVRELVSEGLGRCKIADKLCISKSVATRLIKQVREKEELPVSPYATYGEDYYSIAKDRKVGLKAAKTYYQKNNDVYDPMGESFRFQVSRGGVTLNHMKKEFAITGRDRALEIIKEEFPTSFIVETNLEDGDIHFMPIEDQGASLQKPTPPPKKFKYWVAPTKNYMTVKFDDDLPGDEIKIYHLTDVHIGSKYFRGEKFDEVLDGIANDPMAFALLGGDMIEVITKASIADPMEQDLTINQQVNAFVHKLGRIQHKVLYSVGGNHDQGRTFKTCEFDLAEAMAAMIDVPYSNVRTTIDLNFRGVNKRISLTHRYGNAHSVAAVEGAVKKAMSFSTFHTDAFLSGHNHRAFLISLDSTVLIPGRGFYTDRSLIINGGSFTTQTGSYGEVTGYPPSPQDQYIFKFNTQGKHSVETIEMLSE
jgi:hypothetical protein